ncbi:MAG: HD domain-containing protein [Acidobacteria bacterium]|nr:HD domain-containing protein [Acidobacteriota bacterium]
MSASYRQRITALTEKYGGEWAVQHAQRLIRLVETIGHGLAYDPEVIWLAAHMHDWGTLPRWSRDGVSHCARSRELAAEQLRKLKLPEATAERVLEAIQYHHGGADDRCIEAQLLRDADALDGLGLVGLLREFACVPTEGSSCYSIPTGYGMSGAYERARMRLENNPRMVRLPRSKKIATERAREMRAALDAFERESFGLV